jgi:hypothetical protein
MRKAYHMIAASFSACCIFGSCSRMASDQPADVRYAARQIIPITIEAGKPIAIDIESLSGNTANSVGIRCSDEIWCVLAKETDKIAVHLKSSNRNGTEIGGVSPDGSNPWHIESFHYLFHIYGMRGAKATVEVTFPNAPPGTTRAQVIVCKTPIDTKPF